VQRRLHAAIAGDQDGLGALLADVRAGAVDPYAAAVRILADPKALGALLARRSAHE